jgi:hypothetical protein
VRDARSKWPILRMWNDGFAVAAEEEPRLRGLVHICSEDRAIFQGLVVAVEAVNEEIHFEFKRLSLVQDTAPTDIVAPVSLHSAASDHRHLR